PGRTERHQREHAGTWKRIDEFVLRHSGAKIGMQLGHAGRKGATTLEWLGTEPIPPSEGGWPLLAPSPIPWGERSQVPKEMTRQDMDSVREDFVRATHMAQEAGFDGL